MKKLNEEMRQRMKKSATASTQSKSNDPDRVTLQEELTP